MCTNHSLISKHSSQSLDPNFTSSPWAYQTPLANTTTPSPIFPVFIFELPWNWNSSLQFFLYSECESVLSVIEPCSAASQGGKDPFPNSIQPNPTQLSQKHSQKQNRRITCKPMHPGHVTHLSIGSIWYFNFYFLFLFFCVIMSWIFTILVWPGGNESERLRK